MDAFRTLIETLSLLILPLLIVGFPLYGLLRRVPVYEAFVEGAREGFDVAVRIIPYLVAILFAIGMFRASGAMDFLIELLRPVLHPLRIPPEVLPMAILRPLTGSGSAAVVLDLIRQYGEDSLFVKIAAVMFGSTETTFYVLVVYFGAVNISKTRHAVPAGLIADVAAMLMAIYLVQWLFAG
ncbi:MAG: spore maturation protein [Rhodothermus sp.]|nr:spore maturation protein [Rhodothermus sp.]